MKDITYAEAFEILRDDDKKKSYKELGFNTQKEFSNAWDVAYQMALNLIERKADEEKFIEDWLNSFNTESATACFTAIQNLKSQIQK